MSEAINNVEPSPAGTAQEARQTRTEECAEEDALWGRDMGQFEAFSRSVSINYVVLAVQAAVGILMLPFNVSHLGQSSYGLWVLAASIPAYFSLFDLGYGVAQVKFAAECRARRDAEGLNQIVSTLFCVFALIGLLVFAVAALIAFNLETFFNVSPEQAATGRFVLLALSLYVALGFPFSVFGGVVNGFQRHFLNGKVAIATTLIVAAVNLLVLSLGYGLIELVAATTAVRILSYYFYRRNAYRAFPALRLNFRYFRFSRLREVTGLSVFLLLIDLANKINYSADALVIGAFLSTVAVSVWAVAQRLIETTQTVTSQANGALFPVVVDIATIGDKERLRQVLIQGTLVSLAMVIPVATGLLVLARPLVVAWVGPAFEGSVPVIYVLAVAVTTRVGCSMATTLLKGAGRHRLLAFVNVAAAISNVGLSILFVRRFGLVGVAFGTAIPLGVVSILILFPAACRRVELPIWRAISRAVWPAIWPAAPMALLLIAARGVTAYGLLSVALLAIGGGAFYALLFIGVALPREDREWYESRVRGRLTRLRALAV
jgi:O-antigen/teichoic acid export membrane protein